MNTGKLSAKDWILSSSSGTLSYLINFTDYYTIDKFREFVALNEHTDVEDYILDFYISF